jgi:PAS domain S-box-containing protein
MGGRAGEVVANIDAGVLGKAMLDAARAAGIGVTVTMVDTPTPRHMYVSEAAAAILGWSLEELFDRDPLSNISPRDRQRASERLARRTAGEQGPLTYELIVDRKDGTQVPIEVTATHATVEGRPAVVAFIVDSSVRREAERERLRNEARFRDLIDSAPEPIGIVREGRFVYVNRAYVTALGYPDAESLCRVPLSAMLGGEEAAIREGRERATIERGVRQPPQVYRVRRYDGTTVHLEVSSVYLEYEGKAAVLSIGRDVTERKVLERRLAQADRLAALGTLAAGVAHEINNPLAYVMLNLEWVARKLPGVRSDAASLEGLTAMLTEARQGVERVSTIVRELRSFSRIDGEMRAPVDLGAVVESALKIAGHEIRPRARVITSCEPVRPVLASESRLEQVVVNLLLNAAQAMPSDRIDGNEIRVSVRPDGDGHAVLEVTDNGPGVPADVLPRIFDPFFTTKPVGLGTGLGLSICHGIVMSLGGRIAVYSEPGEGASFRVRLPTVEPRGPDEPVSASVPSSRAGPRARILVVDDELPIANTLRELLAPVHEVVAATSGAEALAALEAAEFDVVFCDLVMPGMSGMDLYQRIRAERPSLAPRVVFMTGGAFTERNADFLSSVENLRVEKPFSLGVVESIVRDLMDAAAAPAPR